MRGVVGTIWVVQSNCKFALDMNFCFYDNYETQKEYDTFFIHAYLPTSLLCPFQLLAACILPNKPSMLLLLLLHE